MNKRVQTTTWHSRICKSRNLGLEPYTGLEPPPPPPATDFLSARQLRLCVQSAKLWVSDNEAETALNTHTPLYKLARLNLTADPNLTQLYFRSSGCGARARAQDWNKLSSSPN